MINDNSAYVTTQLVRIQQMSLWVRKKMVLVAVVISALPWARGCSSLLIAGTQRCLWSGSCCNFFILCDGLLGNRMDYSKTMFFNVDDKVGPL
jgi:hypothetical protein